MSSCSGTLLLITYTLWVHVKAGASKSHETEAAEHENPPRAAHAFLGPDVHRPALPREPTSAPSPRQSTCSHSYLQPRNNSHNFNLQLLCKLPPGLIYNS